MNSSLITQTLQQGTAIPAHPLALTSARKLDERRQRALSRYYIASGVGGLAVAVHTTQFEIRNPGIDLFQPVLELAAEEMDRADRQRTAPLLRVSGICGETSQATQEAIIARDAGYHFGLLSLSALKSADEDTLIQHCQAISEIIPVFGFYLQPDVGGRLLPYSFWRRFCEIENIAAIKMAPFNRYHTLDVIRAVAESGREDIALYTGNDDNILLDLVTPFRFHSEGKQIERRIVGGLLGHWAVWTRNAVTLLEECQQIASEGTQIPVSMLQRNTEITDCNAVLFDVAHRFQGCIPGIHEILKRQRLLDGIWCLNPDENLSPGQSAEIDRIYQDYPHLNDDAFVEAHRDEWLSG
ncbi:MAG: dihydrodipicolinate synthase family protein [Planctomycetes bacterium]|nr:dihydrodipicolinate synthase family protein [Planctomycetota bacterium]MCH9774839.1 dihydrodipicolinate synthase family protein [Planctomycetota bacterium]MCH9792834.1 dihydrodipicolinate synthase family protein [Planctomycetota bacterium]MDF1743605.1 dihydrodipicolinate synthase family protein [Gimesia sp.]